jgi:hypothetical protein
MVREREEPLRLTLPSTSGWTSSLALTRYIQRHETSPALGQGAPAFIDRPVFRSRRLPWPRRPRSVSTETNSWQIASSQKKSSDPRQC